MSASKQVETAVKKPLEIVNTEKLQLVTHDYRPALQSAVSWLGNRYLLAEPVAKRSEERKAYFVEQRRWHPATRH
jgi:hypothetical protein